MSNSTVPALGFNPDLCTLDTCDINFATVRYDPSLAGNALYLAIFAVLFVAQLFFGIRNRTWGFLGGMFGGLLLEIIGYVARIQMHYNPFLANPFLMYLICLTIAPAFMSAAIYVCLSRIIPVYGEDLARFRPRTYTIVFISCDLFSLVLQAVGGAIADTSNSGSSAQQTGINIMIAGLAFQVISLSVFIILCTDFAWRVRKNRTSRPLSNLSCSDARFHGFLSALALATVCIYVRSCFRVAELQGGFGGTLANDEITFMILEGAMIVIASTALTVFHPGLIFGETWNIAKNRGKQENEASSP